MPLRRLVQNDRIRVPQMTVPLLLPLYPFELLEIAGRFGPRPAPGYRSMAERVGREDRVVEDPRLGLAKESLVRRSGGGLGILHDVA